jgi:hypothetical protein
VVRRAVFPHEVIHDQHPPALEHIGERDGAAATDDHDRLYPRHWQAPARGGQFVAGVRMRLLADQQFRSGLLPLIMGNDLGGCGFCHGVLLCCIREA